MTANIQTLATFEPGDLDQSSFICDLNARYDYASWYRWLGGSRISDELVEMLCDSLFGQLSYRDHSITTLVDLANSLNQFSVSNITERRNLFNAYCRAHFNSDYSLLSFIALDGIARLRKLVTPE